MTRAQQKESLLLNARIWCIEGELLRIRAGFEDEKRERKRRKLTRAFKAVSKRLDKANEECYLLRKEVFCDLSKN